MIAIVVYMSSEIMTSVLGGKRHDSNLVLSLEVVAPTVSLIAGLLLLRMGNTREGIVYALLSASMLGVRLYEQSGTEELCTQTATAEEHPMLIMTGCMLVFGAVVGMVEAAS